MRRRSFVESCKTCQRELADARRRNPNADPNRLFAPPHDASERCESGGHDHCTCDTCF